MVKVFRVCFFNLVKHINPFRLLPFHHVSLSTGDEDSLLFPKSPSSAVHTEVFDPLQTMRRGGREEGESRPFRTDHHPFSDLLLGGFRRRPRLCGASSVFQLRGPHVRTCFITCSFFIENKTSYFADKGLFLPILPSPVSVSPPLSVQTPPQSHSVCSEVQGTNTRAAPRPPQPFFWRRTTQAQPVRASAPFDEVRLRLETPRPRRSSINP